MLSNRRVARTDRILSASFLSIVRLALSAFLVTTCLEGLHERPADSKKQRVVRQVYLMGTKASLEIYSASRGSGLSQLEKFVEIMELTEEELTNWNEESTISHLNTAPVGDDFPLDTGACRLVEKVFELYRFSDGAFDPAVGRLLAAWGINGSARLPDPFELERARNQSGLHLLGFSPEKCMVSRRGEVLLDSGAFGKGEALDRVRVYSEEGGADPWLINFGGQVAVYGLPPGSAFWQVGLSSLVDRGQPYTTVNLTRGSVATSGNSQRRKSINGLEVGHILDPRTGRPSLFSGSATVWHGDALAADALSTALHVMGPEEGIEWASLNGVAVCFTSVSKSGHLEVRKNRFFSPLVSP